MRFPIQGVDNERKTIIANIFNNKHMKVYFDNMIKCIEAFPEYTKYLKTQDDKYIKSRIFRNA